MPRTCECYDCHNPLKEITATGLCKRCTRKRQKAVEKYQKKLAKLADKKG